MFTLPYANAIGCNASSVSAQPLDKHPTLRSLDIKFQTLSFILSGQLESTEFKCNKANFSAKLFCL